VIVVLAREDVPLHFTEAHLVDLKAVLAADASEPCQSEADAVASAAVAAGV
jgi:hypothetical protein